MTPDQIREVMRRIDGIWPPRKAPTHEERAEWVRFLHPLDGAVSLRAVDGLRENTPWRPSMADFRSAYWQAAAEPGDDVLMLPAGDSAPAINLTATYGSRREEWTYCWRCDMAISLEEMEEMVYDELRGLRHHECPPAGSAPRIPTKQLLERREYWNKMKLSKEGG